MINGLSATRSAVLATAAVFSVWIVHWSYGAITEWQRTRAPAAYDKCVRSTTQSDWVLVDGKLKHITIDICLKYVVMCRPAGEGYVGPLTCASVVKDRLAEIDPEQPEY